MLDPRFSFGRFVAGTGTRVAAEAARRVAESPGGVYNPLVIVGALGVGKTHLLHAIGNLAQSLQPDLTVHLESVETLAQHVTDGVAVGVLDNLTEALGRLDLLLIDDLERIAGLGRTQHELLTICEATLERHRQLVVASELSPGEIPGLSPPLAALFMRGLIIDLAPPDEACRLAIVRQLARERRVALPAPVAGALAALSIENVRALELATLEVLGTAEHESREPSPDDVHHALRFLDARDGSDEFATFLREMDVALAAVVETAPWRRRIAAAILRWEGEGIRTRRLEEALDTDTAPDVDSLIERFERDAKRLVELRSRMAGAAEPSLLDDPDRLAEVETLYRARGEGDEEARREAAAGRRAAQTEVVAAKPDTWFLDPGRVVMDWVGAEERLVEDGR